MISRESQIQQSAVRWFRLQYPNLSRLLVHIPNEGKRNIKMIKGRAVCIGGARLKAEGLVKGASDLVLFVPNENYHALCLETKVGGEHKTYQSKEQKEWQQEVENQGYKYVVYRSIDEFISIINEYLKHNL